MAGSMLTALPNFDELYETYAEFVWRSARRLGVVPAALDDAVQDVFLVAHRRLDSVENPEALRAWLYGIVIRVVRDYRRGLARKARKLGEHAGDLEPDKLVDPKTEGPEAAVEQNDAVRLLHCVLAELDDAKREVFVLAELEELSEAEIANVLGEGKNTVHSRLRAARVAFEKAVLRHQSRDEWRLR